MFKESTELQRIHSKKYFLKHLQFKFYWQQSILDRVIVKVKWKMQRIDRTRRHCIYKLRSGKRVLIILVVIGGIFLICCYVLQLLSQSSINTKVYDIDIQKWHAIKTRKQATTENYGPHSGDVFKTTKSSTEVDPLSLEDIEPANTFITIGGGGSGDLTITTTEGEGNESEPDYDTGTVEFEPFLDQFSMSSNFPENDSSSKPFKNHLFTFYCKNLPVRRVQKRNKNMIVYENFINPSPNQNMECHESISYTTHGDYRYLDNLIPVVNRWKGPVSVAIYCPGSDLRKTLKIISFLRICAKIQFVSFHLFFDASYSTPAAGESHWQWLDSIYQEEIWKNCSERPNPKRLRSETTFRIKRKLLYPVNVARNIARSAATTHFVLVSDIELYPSINLIPSFFKMLHEQHKASGNEKSVTIPARQVYVLPIFEIKLGVKPPETKMDLIPLLRNGNAITFHKHICKECHVIPKFNEWFSDKSPPKSLKVFYSAKRVPPYQFWEPIYIGTKYEPMYDERLSWEGLRDKMTQGYILCVLKYNFAILDNAYLIHRPGIKRLIHKITKTVLRQDRLINLKIKVEFFRRFGKQSGCTL